MLYDKNAKSYTGICGSDNLMYALEGTVGSVIGHEFIVVLASNGSYVCCGGIPAYGACKHAVAGLLKSAAKEFMAFGARVNYICPGGLDTKLMRKTVENFLPGKTYEEGCEIFSHAYLDNRLCTVEDVANAMLFLASDVSSHMIGDALCLDGGLAVDRK